MVSGRIYRLVEADPVTRDATSGRLDPDDYRAHLVLGYLYSYQGKHAKSRAEFDRALRINPNDANLLAHSAEHLVYCGRVKEALERCEPRLPLWVTTGSPA